MAQDEYQTASNCQSRANDESLLEYKCHNIMLLATYLYMFVTENILESQFQTTKEAQYVANITNRYLLARMTSDAQIAKTKFVVYLLALFQYPEWDNIAHPNR